MKAKTSLQVIAVVIVLILVVCVTGVGFLYVQRERELDTALVVESPFGSKVAAGSTFWRMMIFGGDDYFYRLSAHDESGNELFSKDVPIPRDIWQKEVYGGLDSRTVEDVTFLKHGKIIWSKGNHEVTFVIHDKEILRQEVR